jgi:hypothetical protein
VSCTASLGFERAPAGTTNNNAKILILFTAEFTDAETPEITVAITITTSVTITIGDNCSTSYSRQSRLFTPYPLGGSECWGRERVSSTFLTISLHTSMY